MVRVKCGDAYKEVGNTLWDPFQCDIKFEVLPEENAGHTLSVRFFAMSQDGLGPVRSNVHVYLL